MYSLSGKNSLLFDPVHQKNLDELVRSFFPPATLPPAMIEEIARLEQRFGESDQSEEALADLEAAIARLISLGQYPRAFAWLYALASRGIGGLGILLSLALLLHDMGNEQASRAIFRELARQIPHSCTYEILVDSAPFSPAAGRAFFESFAWQDERLAHILQATSFLGPCDGSCGSRGDAEYRIGRLLERRFRDWEAGAIEPPCGPNLPHAPGELPVRQPRILLLMPGWLEHDERNPPCPTSWATLEQARHRGLPAEFFAGDLMLSPWQAGNRAFLGGREIIRTPEVLAEQIRLLEAKIREFKPDILMADLGFVPGEDTLQAKDLRALKEKYGFRMVAYLTDDYYSDPPCYIAWSQVCDVLLINDPFNSYVHLADDDPGKAFWHVSLSPKLFQQPARKKDIDFLFLSHMGRTRNVYMNALQAAGIPVFYQPSSYYSKCRLDDREYAELFARAKITFTNGLFRARSNVDIIVGRSFESILTRTLLLQEEGNALPQFFVPYVHYMPVRNVHEAVHFARFFLKHDDWRERVVEGARQWCLSHYSMEQNWEGMLCHILRPDLRRPMKAREF